MSGFGNADPFENETNKPRKENVPPSFRRFSPLVERGTLAHSARFANILLVYPGKEYTAEYAAQIRALGKKWKFNITPVDNFMDALDKIHRKNTFFDVVVACVDIPRSRASELIGELQRGLGRQLVEIVLHEEKAMRAVLETCKSYELYGIGPNVHMIPKNILQDGVRVFQEAVHLALAAKSDFELRQLPK